MAPAKPASISRRTFVFVFAREEMANLLPGLWEQWNEFAELYRKARLPSDRSNGRYDSGAGSLFGGDVEQAFDQMRAAVDRAAGRPAQSEF